MKMYERLAETARKSRRTGMDALEVLRKKAGFQDDDRAELIDIRFDSPTRKTICRVSLPSATHFEAIPQGFPAFRRFEIARLNQAWIDGRGRVMLKDGSELRALKIEPLHLPINPSTLVWRIVHLTLELVGAKHCYRSLREDFPPDQRDMVPHVHFLDAARLSGLELPSLQDIERYIASRYKKVSGQQIANALRTFGIRHPEARPA